MCLETQIIGHCRAEEIASIVGYAQEQTAPCPEHQLYTAGVGVGVAVGVGVIGVAVGVGVGTNVGVGVGVLVVTPSTHICPDPNAPLFCVSNLNVFTV